MKKLLLLLFVISNLALFISCGEETVPLSGDYSFKIRMTDAPGPYNKVNIDIRGVSILDGNGQTVNLNTNAGVHNLLELTNGADMLLATSYLNNPEIKHIRLTLGTENTVMVNNISYPLELSNEDQSGLKLLINQTLNDNADNEILIDFDANASVVDMGNNTYKLKPVIRIIDPQLSGSISGVVDNTSMAVISATSSSNLMYSSNVSHNGQFKVAGLPPGTYTVTITPVLPTLPITQTNINVMGGSDTVVTSVVF